MKKFLLSLAVSVTAAFGAFGQTVIKANQFDVTKAVNVGGYTVELQKNDGGNAPFYHAGTDAIRLYAKGSLTVSGERITKIVVTLASDAAARYTTFTPSVGALAAEQAAGDTEITWEGDAASVSFTVGASATMGTDGESKAGQIRFSQITVYGEGGAVTPDPDPEPDPDPVETVGEGTKENPYTIADVIALNNTVATGWVKGYIVGSSNNGAALAFTPITEAQSKSNVLLADKADETEVAKMVPVQLPTGDIRTAINLDSNPGNVGKTLAISGDLTAYFGVSGIKNPTEYVLDGQGGGDTPNPPATGAPTEGPGSEAQPLTLAEAVAKNNDSSINWVSGVIVGVADYVEGEGNVFNGEAPFTTLTNIVLASAVDATDYFAVQLPAGTIREALNLGDRPALVGREVAVCGKLQKYCFANGMKETSDYSIEGGLPEIAVKETATLTSFIEEQDTENFYKINGAVTVYYQSPDKKYTFITDGESSIEVFGAMTNAYTNGDVLTGVVGKYAYYQNMPQMTPQTETFGEATKGDAVDPVKTTLDQVQLAQYVEIENVDIVAAEEEGKFNVVSGSETRQLFDRFAIGDIKAAEGVTIVGIGAIFGETLQVFPIEIKYDSAIAEISAAAQGETVIYDLQGRKVAKAGKGLYIVNGKKVIL